MSVQITEVKSFAFSIPTPEIGFNMNIVAKDQNEAIRKLTDALQCALDQVKAMVKVGAN